MAPSRAFTEDELKFHLPGIGIHADVGDKYMPLRNKSYDYVIDREIQRTTTFSGIRGIGEQDMAVQESMGAIVERPREHLGSSDAAVIAMRRRLIREARNLQEGIEPPTVMPTKCAPPPWCWPGTSPSMRVLKKS